MGRLVDLTGSAFGRLTVVRRSGSNKHSRATWECLCKCGTTTIVSSSALIQHMTRSCGCFKKEKAVETGKNSVRHGHAVGKKVTSIYTVWSNMLDRCTRESNSAFHRYGGRGISVCARWATFDNFLEDMGERPQGATIERIDNMGNYEPSNCRWATMAEQSRNRSNNVWVDFRGEKLVLADMAAKHGLRLNTLRRRLLRGWDIERAINTPAKEIA